MFFFAGFILLIFFIILLTMLATIIDAMLIAKRNKKKPENSERVTKQSGREERIMDTESIQEEDFYDEDKIVYSYDQCIPEVFDTLRDK